MNNVLEIEEKRGGMQSLELIWKHLRAIETDENGNWIVWGGVEDKREKSLSVRSE